MKKTIAAENSTITSADTKAEKPATPWFESFLKIIQAAAITAGVIISVLQYMKNSKNQREDAAREYQKTFYQAQMNVYAEAVNATSLIATTAPGSEAYETAKQQFYHLFWGRMSIFEDKCVEQKMVQFRKLLIKFEKEDFNLTQFYDSCNHRQRRFDTVSQVTLKFASLQLAYQCRVYTVKTWLPPNEQNNYDLDMPDILEQK